MHFLLHFCALFSSDNLTNTIRFYFSTQLTDPPVLPCVNRRWYKYKTESSSICTNGLTTGLSTTFVSFSACCMNTDASSYNDTCDEEVGSVPCPIPPTTPPVPPPQTDAPVTPQPQPMVSIFMNACVLLTVPMLQFLIIHS